MNWLKEEQGISLLEVIASIVLITIILLSFSTIFLQSKKTNVLSESFVDSTYTAQEDMETVYGMVTSMNIKDFQELESFNSQGTKFIYISEATCTVICKKFVSTTSPEYWIKLQLNSQYSNLVNVLVNVPKHSSSTPVIMESVFRWGGDNSQ